MKDLLHKGLRLPPGDRRLALEVGLLMSAIRLALKLFPLTMVCRALDRTAGRLSRGAAAPGHALERAIRMVEAGGRQLLGDRPCLVQALAVRWWLRRWGCPAELCIGVRKDPAGALAAHAWIESEGRVVTGGPEEALAQYARLPALEWRAQ